MDYYGVMGNPIRHSKSPLIHRLFAEQTHQSLAYKPILVELDGLPTALLDFQVSEGGKGLNITLPFKQRAYGYAQHLTERAIQAKAINTIRFDADGSIMGDNTDGVGLVRDITQNNHFSIRGKSVLLLGAGGTVRGIIGPILAESPKQLVIANRTESKAQALAAEFASIQAITGCKITDLAGLSFDLIINATSASLHEDVLELPSDILNAGAYCYDVVYGKGETPFLHWARAHKAALRSDGLGMLVEQAAESFYFWRNVMPLTAPVLTVVRETLALSSP
ncbi:MAG: shikimate dehydrogenase [Gammaproteobacteria bacterium]|nr:shikimate dehydrogenase [Gammaproteobacteria bacterium]